VFDSSFFSLGLMVENRPMKFFTVRYCLALIVMQALVSPGVGATEPKPNTLSGDEQAAGWELLFDGVNAKEWRSFKKATFPSKGWTVEDGWLKCLPKGRGGDLISIGTFDDFELRWEWRIPSRANSGIKYFITEERSQAIGHEYQMIDDNVFKSPKGQTAAFYDVLPPRPHKPIKLAPESNHSKIIVRGNRVEHWLNGEQVLDYQLGSPEVLAAVQKSKFKDVQGFGLKKRTHILLTEHSDEAWFRNIKIMRLSPEQ
jgi:hypothetical protein